MKRFYQDVAVEKVDGGYQVCLDGRPIKTPAKHALVMPTEALATAVQTEWDAQVGDINPKAMHMTQLANTSVDRVQDRMTEIKAEILGFADTDLLCYRADGPQNLVVEQTEVWGEYLDWVKQYHGVELMTTAGIMPVAQDKNSLAKIDKILDDYSAFALAGMHGLTNGLGSVILALAFMAEFKPIEALWEASQLDEIYQAKTWGEDAEAMEQRQNKRTEVMTAAAFLSTL